jgi:AcrR family transcriptional regulator
MTQSQLLSSPPGTRPARTDHRHGARILRAMIATAGEHGVQAASVQRVSDAAGVSTATFRALFADRGECLLAALQCGVELARQGALEAYAAKLSWIERIRAGLFALLEIFDVDRPLARLCLLEAQAIGPAAQDYRGELLAQLASLVDEGRRSARVQPPPLTAEGVLGGTISIVQTHLLDPQPASLRALINPLMSFIAFPYLGSGAARAQLTYSSPPVASAHPTQPGMRLA